MGNYLSQIVNLFYRREIKILMLGLDNAGKTSIILKLKPNELSTNIPAIGLNIESF